MISADDVQRHLTRASDKEIVQYAKRFISTGARSYSSLLTGECTVLGSPEFAEFLLSHGWTLPEYRQLTLPIHSYLWEVYDARRQPIKGKSTGIA